MAADTTASFVGGVGTDQQADRPDPTQPVLPVATVWPGIQLERIKPFSSLRGEVNAVLRTYLRRIALRAGEPLFREGDRTGGRLYIIVTGEVSICKCGHDPVSRAPLEYEVAVRGPEQIVGSVSLLDRRPASATARCRTDVIAAVLDLDAIPCGSLPRKVRRALENQLAFHLATRLRDNLDARVDALRHEAELAGYRNAIALVLVGALSMLSVYTLALGAIAGLDLPPEARIGITPLVILMFAAAFLSVIRLSRFPPAFYGLRLDNWRPALSLAVKASLIFLAGMAAAKWLLIATVPALGHFSLLTPAPIGGAGPPEMSWAVYAGVAALYALFVPAQEFVARCGIQAPLYAFLDGSEFTRRTWAILVSNFAFAAAHAHTNPTFALATFLPGIFWGWLFARTHSLLAVSVSHVMIGGAGIFLFGIEDFLAALF
ncbi:cyclic nucleotide-binding domain-containing protein [Dichotomicrobium thermohalophilum]|nr:cyclic nucleotide-binding domain-containing protein [Dichotomicrobium thermohalophilum]